MYDKLGTLCTDSNTLNFLDKDPTFERSFLKVVNGLCRHNHIALLPLAFIVELMQGGAHDHFLVVFE